MDTNSVYYIRVPTLYNTEKCIILILNFNIFATYGHKVFNSTALAFHGGLVFWVEVTVLQGRLKGYKIVPFIFPERFWCM